MHSLLHLLSDPAWCLLIGGFSLFGRSGDDVTSNQVNNTTNDTTTTTTNSNNISSAANLNAALTRNSSFIQNDSRVQNTALQLTDAFNRFSTNNLANVGNTTINSPGAGGGVDYAALFGALPQGQTMHTTPVDLSKSLIDFTAISQTNANQLAQLTGLNKSIQDGFAKNVDATGKTTVSLANTTSGQATNQLVLYGALALAAVLGLFIIFRRR